MLNRIQQVRRTRELAVNECEPPQALAQMPTFARTRGSCATLVVSRGQRAIGSVVLGRQGVDSWRPRCEWWVWVVFVIELQY
jgi:hypothetical protein